MLFSSSTPRLRTIHTDEGCTFKKMRRKINGRVYGVQRVISLFLKGHECHILLYLKSRSTHKKMHKSGTKKCESVGWGIIELLLNLL
jgi:hypothetical protein